MNYIFDPELNLQQYHIHDCTCWDIKDQFALCMRNYIHDLINLDHFESTFSELWWDSIYETYDLDAK